MGADVEMVQVPNLARFPIELRQPPGFRAADLGTWPKVPGRLEYVGGRLLYMTPCGDVQSRVVTRVVAVLVQWNDRHPEFECGTNEAGMVLGDEVRGADAAVWRRADLPPPTGGYVRVAPVLAVEVAGLDEDEPALRSKAEWYLSHGVAVVWLVLPEPRAVVVLTPGGEARVDAGGRLAPLAALPDLSPAVDDFFRRLG